MKFDTKKVFPNELSRFEGFRPIRLIAALYMFVMVVRSCIHLFAPDGGALSIAGIDTSVEGGDNIIAIFHQWGAIQLILALLLLVLFFRYPGLTPLILLTLALDPVLRFYSRTDDEHYCHRDTSRRSAKWGSFLFAFDFIHGLISE